MPSLPVGRAEGTAATKLDLARAACALAAYREEHPSYPRKLDELKPRHLAELPADIFTGGALQYRQLPDAYLLYSLGANGRDDEGRTMLDAENGEDWDDLSVRVPAIRK